MRYWPTRLHYWSYEKGLCDLCGQWSSHEDATRNIARNTLLGMIRYAESQSPSPERESVIQAILLRVLQLGSSSPMVSGVHSLVQLSAQAQRHSICEAWFTGAEWTSRSWKTASKSMKWQRPDIPSHGHALQEIGLIKSGPTDTADAHFGLYEVTMKSNK